jgi:hypothetical protein
MVVKKKELLKFPKSKRLAEFRGRLIATNIFWTKEKLQRLQRNLVVHSK